jgi:acylpyruvate hydrolase
MKLLTYSWKGNVGLGALSGRRAINLRCARAVALRHRGKVDKLPVGDPGMPDDLLELLRCGPTAMDTARQTLQFVEAQNADERWDGTYCSLEDIELLAPVLRPAKIICVGLNYRSHLRELGERVPEYPILFLKAPTSVIGHGQAIVLPRVSGQVDYEGELAVVMGRRAKYVSERDALAHVAGYTCANDVSAHDLEFRTSQWTSGKILDTFCPLGPVLVTADEIPDPNRLGIRTCLNGRTVQDSCTSDMVFSVPFLVSYISSLTTLEPGDVILTGTPAGVGCNRKPQLFLENGDEVSVRIEGIGELANPVVEEEGR